MARIKSALEIALEKTESVKSDKDTIAVFAAKQKGKKLANAFLAGDLESLETEIKKEKADIKANLKTGIFDVLVTQINLPDVQDDIKRIETACQGLVTVIGNKSFAGTVKQFIQLVNQYLGEVTQFEEVIKRQYAPKLQAKEEELSSRLGRPIKIDPFQDPEFVSFYNQNMSALKSNYSAVVDQVRKEARNLFES